MNVIYCIGHANLHVCARTCTYAYTSVCTRVSMHACRDMGIPPRAHASRARTHTGILWFRDGSPNLSTHTHTRTLLAAFLFACGCWDFVLKQFYSIARFLVRKEKKSGVAFETVPATYTTQPRKKHALTRKTHTEKPRPELMSHHTFFLQQKQPRTLFSCTCGGNLSRPAAMSAEFFF